ncbi:MAG: molybdopterin molybdenumtransferase MoeA, partial [Epsilonproteobacteria bacterium]|nr:molybdopterin molybdenumtransferase MoeA [Campylobacterota bacterium]
YFYPYKNNKYGSGMIMPLAKSNVVAIFDENCSFIEKNKEIEVRYIK